MRVSAVLFALAAAASPAAADDAFFRQRIEPLLQTHCIDCHAGSIDDVGGGLWLDHARGLLIGGDSGPAVVPHDPDASVLLQALRYDGIEMPPDGRLSDDEVALFEQWIAAGGADPRDHVPEEARAARPEIDIEAGRQFWAFRPLERVEWLPQGPAAVDAAVGRRLSEARLSRSERATPATQIRRLAYVLTGLPPSQQEQEAFERDPSDEHWTQLVDRWLASPAFGEQWGRHWLDVARYADSNGSDFNVPFADAWRYRNYVIDAFDRDRPYDEFVRQQIAGDLLPASSREAATDAIVATGFLAIGPKMLSERDKEKLRMDVVDEQIDTVGKAFLGLTLGCARCHDHKFDPISQRDYYAMAGVFRSTQTLDGEIQRYVSDTVRLPLPSDPAMAAARATYEAELADLIRRRDAIRERVERQSGREAALAAGVVIDNDDATVVGRWKESTFSPQRVGANYLHSDRDPDAGSVRYAATLPPGRYDIRVSYSGSGGRETKTEITIQTGGSSHSVRLNQAKRPAIANLFASIGTFEVAGDVAVTLHSRGSTGYVIADAVQFVAAGSGDAAVPAADPGLAADLKAVEDAIAAHKAAAPPQRATALGVRDIERPADCTMRIRGEPHLEGEVVARGMPRVLCEGDSAGFLSEQSGRREMATWIADESNPLTARVIVNRVWSHVFGRGLVRTPDNFGRLGERPTHPELLDALAVDFVASGWSMKRLVRRLVLSETFRQSSRSNAGESSDIENRLLWRANRRPLSAEELRDTLLTLDGRLGRGQQGPTLTEHPKVLKTLPKPDKSTQVARTIYLPVVRTLVPPSQRVFDFADPDVVVGKRPLTNVPSQALFLLNSPDVRDAAEAIAIRAGSDPIAIYRLVLGRRPTADEAERFATFARSVSWTDAVHALLSSTEFRLLD